MTSNDRYRTEASRGLFKNAPILVTRTDRAELQFESTFIFLKLNVTVAAFGSVIATK